MKSIPFSSSLYNIPMFQYISDTHLECMGKKIDYSTIITPQQPYLICAGDIGRVFYQTGSLKHYPLFIEYCASRWQKVFIIFGNHEAWGRSIVSCRSKVKDIANAYDHVYFMENTTAEFPELGIFIAGCTLWANVSEYTFQRMGDRNIKLISNKINSTQLREWHRESKYFIENLPELANKQRWIVVTHHAPFLPCQTDNIDVSSFDDAYYSRVILDSNKISHCVFGHTHIKTDIMINGVRFLSNPFGYSDETKVRKKYDGSASFAPLSIVS